MFGHATYLVFELGWSLPVILLHWLLDAASLRRRWRVIVTVTVCATCYLTLADGVAIAAHIWSLHTARIVGVRIVNVPIEESIFFLTTNLMVVQSLILLQPRAKRVMRRTAHRAA